MSSTLFAWRSGRSETNCLKLSHLSDFVSHRKVFTFRMAYHGRVLRMRNIPVHIPLVDNYGHPCSFYVSPRLFLPPLDHPFLCPEGAFYLYCPLPFTRLYLRESQRRYIKGDSSFTLHFALILAGPEYGLFILLDFAKDHLFTQYLRRLSITSTPRISLLVFRKLFPYHAMSST